MKLISNVKQFFLTVCLCLIALTPAHAGEMVSIKGSIVNMRAGPSTQSEVLWQLRKGYPLEVLKHRGRWLQVRDFENDRGWVAKSLTSKTPYHIVKTPTANVRKGPSTKYRIVGKAERFEVLRTRKKSKGWVNVRREDGQTGWISRKLLWGW